MDKIIEPFVNIPLAPIPTATSDTQGAQFLSNLREFNVGDGGTKVFRMDKQGIWLGGETFATARFSVDMTGHVEAVSVTLSGYIQTGNAANDINSNVTTISGGKITTNSISADKISVTNLSSISADIGTITAGSITGITITGGTIRTSATYPRIELQGSSNELQIFDSSNVKRVVGYLNGFNFYNASSSFNGSIYANSTNFLINANAEGVGTNSGILYLSAGSSGTIQAHLGGSGSTQRLSLGSAAVSVGNIALGNGITITLANPTNVWGGNFEVKEGNIISSGTINGLTISSGNITLPGSSYYLNCNGGYIDDATAIYLLPRSSAPGAFAGAMYYDSDDNHFYGYNGSTWVQLDN